MARMPLDEPPVDGEIISGRYRAHNSVVRLSPDTAAEIGAADGEAVTGQHVTRLNHLPCSVTDMPGPSWLPLNSAGLDGTDS